LYKNLAIFLKFGRILTIENLKKMILALLIFNIHSGLCINNKKNAFSMDCSIYKKIIEAKSIGGLGRVMWLMIE
jgi:hypothetical protein